MSGSVRLARSKDMSFTSPGRSSRAPRGPGSRANSGKRPTTARTRSGRRQGSASTTRSGDCNSISGEMTAKDAIAQPEVAAGDGTGSVIVDHPKSSGSQNVGTELPEFLDLDQTSKCSESQEGFNPAPDVAKEEEEEVPLVNPPANRPLSAYSELVKPEDFDGQYFLSSVRDLVAKLSEDQYQNLDPDMPVTDLEAMVRAVSATLSSFQSYAVYAQTHAEGLRDQMKLVKDRMLKKIQQKAYDPSSASERLSLEERELEAKLAQLNKSLARTAEELARACTVCAESETAAVQAALVAERASAQAAQTQAEYEARRDAEHEKQHQEEERRRVKLERQHAEAERAERDRQEEAARRQRLRRGDSPSAPPPTWQNWPVYSYDKEPGDFDHGVTAVVRADPALVKEAAIRADVLDQTEAGFVYGYAEQLVSNIVCLSAATDGQPLPAPVIVALPHCMSRASATTREPIIKCLMDSAWVELKSREVTLDDKKDIKFVQAEVTQFTTLAVVTRFKRDFLQISKRGGKETSNVDSRVTFLAQKDTFKRTENFVLQLQPVDSGTVTDVKALPEGAGLLCASSVVNMEWTSPSFGIPITVTLPCPPNPVKAKKAAAIRAAKEAEMKNPGPSPLQLLEEARKREEIRDKPPTPKNRWYMGQYSVNDDDDSDVLHMVSRRKGKWRIVRDIDILQARLDLLQFDLSCPIDTFMVLRTRPTVGEKEAVHMAEMIDSHLSQSLVIVVVKQSEEEFTDVILNVVPLTKSDKLLHTLETDGYGAGPAPSSQLHMREGDLLEINFRGNITSSEEPTEGCVLQKETQAMTLIYNSHLGTRLGFCVQEVDRFLQKNYSMFRGFVQVHKVVHKTQELSKTDGEEEVSKELVTELLITIPKDGPSSMPVERTVITKAPIVIRNVNDPINEETLREVAAELGDEWKRLAQCLNVKRMRVQAILRNCNQNEDEESCLEEARFEMLLTWVKKVPRGVSKVPILCQALVCSGRGDLAERLSDLDKEFQTQRRGP